MTSFDDDFDRFLKNPHDAAFKSAFQRKDLAAGFFRTYLPEKVARRIDFEGLEIRNASYVDEKLRDRHSDIVYRAKLAGREGYLYLLFEHQSAPDPRMPFRLLCYMVNIWKDHADRHPEDRDLPVILPAVLYHGRRRWNAPLRFGDMTGGDEVFAPYDPDFIYELYDLGEYPDDLLMIEDRMTLGVVLTLMKHVRGEDFPEAYDRAMKGLASVRDRETALGFLEWALHYVFHARDDGEKDRYIEQSLSYFRDEEARRKAMSIAERIRQKGKAEGLEEGRLLGLHEGKQLGLHEGKQLGLHEGKQLGLHEGKQLGLQEGRRKAAAVIVKQLRKKFGRIPPSLEQKLIRADLDLLDRFGENLLDFGSAEEAEHWLDDPAGSGNA